MNRFLSAAAALVIAVVLFAPSVAIAGEKIGVILMHGKDGTVRSKSPIGMLAASLQGQFSVKALDMPWSRSNRFNRTLQESFQEIDEAVAKLKAGGATKVVVGGHSLGAAAALAYATQRAGLAGVLMIAAGHRPDLYMDKNTEAIAKAKALIAAGNPEKEVDIFDVNQGRRISRSLDADIAVSWFDPAGLAVMQNAAPKVRKGTPVLFIIGERDPLHPTGKGLIFKKLPQHEKNAYIVVSGGHKATPTNGASEISAWLKGL